MLSVDQKSFKQFQLNDEAKHIVAHGSHEAVVFNSIPEGGITQAKLMESNANAKLGFAKAMSNGWIEVDKKNSAGPLVVKKVANINDEVQDVLTKIQNMKLDDVPEKSIQDLKKRKLISEMYKNIDLLEFLTRLIELLMLFFFVI